MQLTFLLNVKSYELLILAILTFCEIQILIIVSKLIKKIIKSTGLNSVLFILKIFYKMIQCFSLIFHHL